MKIGLVGAGRAGRALVKAWKESGCQLAGICGGRQAERFASTMETALLSLAELASCAEVLILAVPDRVLPEVASQLAELGLPESLVVLHICGSQSAAVLSPLSTRGIACGSLHPLQSFTEDTEAGAAAARQIYFAADGEARAMEKIDFLAAKLGGQVLPIAPEKRALYHAAACMAANYMTAVLHSAVRMLSACEISEADALQALSPLVQAAFHNCCEKGTDAALTGPVRRGDEETLCRHRELLAELCPEEKSLYEALTAYTKKWTAEIKERDMRTICVQNIKEKRNLQEKNRESM